MKKESSAKDAILNSFVFNFDSPEKVLRERMAYEFYGYPADFLEQFRSGIEKVQKAILTRAAAKYLHKDQLAVLVVGNTEQFDKPLSSLGTVTNVDITIPPPPGAANEAPAAKPAASNPEGKQLAAKVVEAMGARQAAKREGDPQQSDREGRGRRLRLDGRSHHGLSRSRAHRGENLAWVLAIVVSPDVGFYVR